MKRLAVVCLITSLFLSMTLAFGGPAWAADIAVTVNGTVLGFDVPPVIVDGRVLVPLRVIFEALGASVGWDAATRTVAAVRGDTTVRLVIGSQTAYISGEPVALDVPAQIRDGRTLVPLRFVAEALGAAVVWDGATRSITVSASPTVGLAFDVGGRGDKSFNDSAYAGLQKAVTDFNLGGQEYYTYLEPTEGGSDCEQLLRTLAEQGYGFVIANGFLFTDALIKVMAEFPNTMFAMTDGYVADLTEASNLLCWSFAEHEGSFLVGVAAAMASKTGKIGFVGGMTIPLIQKFEAGYVAGAKWFDPDITVVVHYIGSTGEAFRDPVKGKELALAQYQAGCDVVYHAAGGSGIGIIAAAAEQQKWVIGVDADQYMTVTAEEQPWVLTSMMKNIDVAVYDTIDKFLKGTFVGGYTTYNLAVDGVGYSTSNAALTAAMIAKMEEAKAKIVSGEIVVPTAPE